MYISVSEDYGRDLTGVQNLRKKHKRLETEIENHEPAIQVCTTLFVFVLEQSRSEGMASDSEASKLGSLHVFYSADIHK